MNMSPEFIVLGALWYLVFLFSTTLHEAAHAWAAQRGGDYTAAAGGQVTLDPRPHIQREPFGMVIFPLLTYFMSGWMMGWASAPYDPYWAARYPRRAALMSLAGPASNLLLVVLSGVLVRGGIAAGFFVPPDFISFTQVVEAPGGGLMSTFATLLSISFMLNLLLGVFNLLPIPPLDGSSVITLFMSERTANRWMDIIRNPGFTIVGMLVAWKIFGPIFRPFKMLALALLYPELSYG